MAKSGGTWDLGDGVTLFCPSLNKIMRWPCFVSLHLGLRVNLSEVGIMRSHFYVIGA